MTKLINIKEMEKEAQTKETKIEIIGDLFLIQQDYETIKKLEKIVDRMYERIQKRME